MQENTSKNSASASVAGASRPKITGEQIREISALAATLGKRGAVGGIRVFLPLLEGYARSLDVAPGQEAPVITKGGATNFSDDEQKVLSKAGSKFAYELIELASLTHPINKDAKPYIAKLDPETGRYPAPNLTQLLSLVQAGQSLLGLGEEEVQSTSAELQMEQDTVALQNKTIFLTAVAPGEYAPVEGPITPLQIRRSAMSQRQLSMKSQNMVSGVNSQKTAMVTQSQYSPSRCCGSAAMTPVARYDKDGNCSDNFFEISCETRWRIRNCFKEMLCDMLYCASEHMCDDGFNENVDMGDVLGDCLETALCSLIRCLPDAICGSKPAQNAEPIPSLECDFAVEEPK